ncbi:DNA ligase [Paenibacillus sp. CAA11]|uniref:ATP-dependent DNA ligase n=1 Tax=Paenibacillus sp. CAA11 TaxID=1532905 RepID=UPI000D38F34F|nr:RNA ligase family protein [Paenibacillus sp. CAA11]AWB43622.1 DNA ligase [Paenibacillus sp. CAA11]
MKLQPVVPFEPITTDLAPSGENWAVQVKWDGVRMLVYNDGEAVRLINRKGNDRTRQYPEFVDTTAYCKASSVILDGEIIALEGGKPSFHQIMKRDSLKRQNEIQFALNRVTAIYMVFDVLYRDGEWLTDLPLKERQNILQEIIVPSEKVQLVQNYPDPAQLFKVMELQGWEGIVCKDLNSVYAPGGKDKRWQKQKISLDLYAVVGGVTYRDGTVNALLLGLYNERGNLRYIGHAGTGKFTVKDWSSITELVEPLLITERPFLNLPERSKGAAWVQPSLTVKVQFLEWTPGGTMRHPVIQSMANIPPEQCLTTQSL